MDTIIGELNHYFWGYILLYGLLGVGIFYTLRLGFLQVRYFGHFFKVLFSSTKEDKEGISSFQALCTSLASRVGTGNIAGVAVALNLGGPGAIFWMWVVAFLGMATAYAESTLAQLYKIHDDKGQFRGGPANYIKAGLKMPFLAHLFAISLILCFGLIFSAVQSNSIAVALQAAFTIPPWATGAILVAVSGLVIFGGIRKIAHVAEWIVPFMATAYVLIALYVILVNITEVPAIFGEIFGHAFGFESAAGGATGGVMAAMMNGVRRGLFSNEAGMGSAPNIAACASPDPHHPSSQGFVQAFGVFIDTIVICTATALIIMLSGVYEFHGMLTGTALTEAAVDVHIGDLGSYFIALAVLFFAFTSIIGNYSYAENAMMFLEHGWKPGILLLRIGALAMVFWGTLQAVSTVFNLADAAMGFMATINLFAILLLSPKVSYLTKDYLSQLNAGKVPHFDIAEHKELTGDVAEGIWTEKRNTI
ncbi:alanine/glycine:cation symporter family protein [Flexibacterium corallicola]|uniref:alanine/glycine:cation symporter family protein n=1 Tax=Flexibacterium corallicola TaxID=3037259 RepID=UPI00286F432E|nr:sodium:alanine symporter family protein [Pseudovibrio sp. M1P-2-3]